VLPRLSPCGADLKPANVLLTGDGTAKLCDFGLARYQIGSALDTAQGGTANYMAWCDRTQDHPEKMDVYSLGMTLWAIFTERVPFAGVDPYQLIHEVTEGRRPLLDDTRLTSLSCGAQLKGLISRCWHQHKLERPSAATVVRELRLIYPSTPAVAGFVLA
jgi:serine/threonine protein kinase